MTLLSQLRLFHPQARDGALLLCAASDLPERFKGQDSLYTKEVIGLSFEGEKNGPVVLLSKPACSVQPHGPPLLPVL